LRYNVTNRIYNTDYGTWYRSSTGSAYYFYDFHGFGWFVHVMVRPTTISCWVVFVKEGKDYSG